MDKNIVVKLHSSFEEIIRRDPETGIEYWLARDLQMLLGYTQWRSFEAVIEKAIIACANSKIDPADHFAHTSKMVSIGSQTKREIEDLALRTNPQQRRYGAVWWFNDTEYEGSAGRSSKTAIG